MALKRIYRLPGNVRMTNARTYNTRAFLLKVAANNDSLSRFGFIVPKTVDKRAVVRNKIRRLFQACVGSMIGRMRPGNDMFFIVRPQVKETKPEEMCGVIQALLKQGGFL